MDLTLYRAVGGLKRIALGDLAEGVEYFTAEKSDDGVITLTPVTIQSGTKLAMKQVIESANVNADDQDVQV